jgi:hypothetical protein
MERFIDKAILFGGIQMSWSGALPIWIYDLEYEHFLAQCSCCFNSEWIPEWSRVVPEYFYDTKKEYYDYS